LVVGVGREGLALLGGDGGVARNEDRHLLAGSLDTERQRSDVDQDEVVQSLALLASQNGSLHSGTVSDGLIGVDALVQLLAVEEVGQQLLDLGDTSGTADKDDLIDGLLVDLGIAKHLLNGLQGGAE